MGLGTRVALKQARFVPGSQSSFKGLDTRVAHMQARLQTFRSATHYPLEQDSASCYRLTTGNLRPTSPPGPDTTNTPFSRSSGAN